MGGNIIRTDRESRAILLSIHNSLATGLLYTMPWKTGSGSWIDASLADVEPLARAAVEYVNRCFEAERQHCAAIERINTVAELVNYDYSRGWPA